MAKEVAKLNEKLTVTLTLTGMDEGDVPNEEAVLAILDEYGLPRIGADPIVVQGAVPRELAGLTVGGIVDELIEEIEKRVRGTVVKTMDPVLGDAYFIESVSIEGGLKKG